MSIKWNMPAVPRSVIQVIPIDSQGLILTHHRSIKCRSAQNVWSFITGLQEVGETLHQTIERELDEEYSFKGIKKPELLGIYENIAGDPAAELQYHWVMHVYAVKVAAIAGFVCKEPDLHDDHELIGAHEFVRPDSWFKQLNYHPSFEAWVRSEGQRIFNILRITALD